MWSKLTIKTPERRRWRRSGVFIVNFENIYTCSSFPIVNFEHVTAGWKVAIIVLTVIILLRSKASETNVFCLHCSCL